MTKNNNQLKMDENWTASEILDKRFPKNPSYAMLERARRILLRYMRELSDIPAEGCRGDYRDLKDDMHRVAKKLGAIMDLHADAFEWTLGFKYRVRQICRRVVQSASTRLDQ